MEFLASIMDWHLPALRLGIVLLFNPHITHNQAHHNLFLYRYMNVDPPFHSPVHFRTIDLQTGAM
jgi:hypothetical protein